MLFVSRLNHENLKATLRQASLKIEELKTALREFQLKYQEAEINLLRVKKEIQSLNKTILKRNRRIEILNETLETLRYEKRKEALQGLYEEEKLQREFTRPKVIKSGNSFGRT